MQDCLVCLLQGAQLGQGRTVFHARPGRPLELEADKSREGQHALMVLPSAHKNRQVLCA